VKQRNILKIRKFISSTCLRLMNSTVGQKWKQKQKSKDLVSFNQNWTCMGFGTVHGPEKSLKAWAWGCRSTFLSHAQVPRQIWKRHCPTTFWCMCKEHYSWKKPINSSNTHMMNQGTHHTFMFDEPRNNILINTTTFSSILKNRRTFWCILLKLRNILMFRMLIQTFK